MSLKNMAEDYFGVVNARCIKPTGEPTWNCVLRKSDGQINVDGVRTIHMFLPDRTLTFKASRTREVTSYWFEGAGANCGVDGTTLKNLTCRRRVQGSNDMCPPI